METKEVFDKYDRVSYLKEGRKLIDDDTAGAEYRFYSIVDGTVVSDNGDTVTIEHDFAEYEIPHHLVFASYEEAVAKAWRLNKKSLSELKEFINFIKNYFPI